MTAQPIDPPRVGFSEQTLRAAESDQKTLDFKGNDRALTERLLATTWTPIRFFWPLLAVTGAGSLMLLTLLLYTAVTGIGVWGNNIPVAWAFGITNFVFWIGIGHAGTFISAFLLLSKQKWRASINRFAEAMTLFAVVNAGLFPLFHMGRPWFFYWLLPYPATMRIWPNFRSALAWDVAAVSTYLITSLLFWYLGLLPDLATLRDYAPGTLRRRIYGVLALGWRGSARGWQRWRIGSGLLGGLAIPLVVSVHTIVSWDFATTILPGWHSTIFPPYFVAGAIFSGFAMVITLMIPARAYFGLHAFVTEKHLDNLAKVLLVTGSLVAYAYIIEAFLGWYTGDPYEHYTLLVDRPRGLYAPMYWTMIACNCLVPQIFWSKRLRTNVPVLFVASVLVNVGMWTERFVLIVTSQHRDFLPSSWRDYAPTVIDGGILVGTFCFFAFLFLVFLRVLPFIPLSEVKELMHALRRRRSVERGT
jgi:molybdopterin-containing oxidoreductase family membrane subunit